MLQTYVDTQGLIIIVITFNLEVLICVFVFKLRFTSWMSLLEQSIGVCCVVYTLSIIDILHLMSKIQMV